jgi:hypothetical protein
MNAIKLYRISQWCWLHHLGFIRKDSSHTNSCFTTLYMNTTIGLAIVLINKLIGVFNKEKALDLLCLKNS